MSKERRCRPTLRNTIYESPQPDFEKALSNERLKHWIMNLLFTNGGKFMQEANENWRSRYYSIYKL